MNLNFDRELKQYRMVVALKKVNRPLVNRGVLFNQKVLTACGEIHAGLMRCPKESQNKFMTDNPDFFAGFAWVYYMDWRKVRAKSCVHLLDVYRMLNVKMGIQDFVGETFYAGIPLVTAEEIEWACNNCQVDGDNVSIPTSHKDFSHEKVGIDGKLHKTDKYGAFESWKSNDDVYNDGSMVSFAELKAACPKDTEPELACLSCVHRDGDGVSCMETKCILGG